MRACSRLGILAHLLGSSSENNTTVSMPGVIVGAIFVTVMVLGEFATASALSGRKVNLLGNIIITQVGSLKWAFAAVVGVVLTVVMGVFVAAMLKIVNLRSQL